MANEATRPAGRTIGTHLLVLLVLGASIGFVFSPLCIHPTDVLVGVHHDGNNDLTAAFLAHRCYPPEERGPFCRSAAWNPYSMCGRPWVGNPQASLHYPINWLAYFSQSPSTLGWLMVAHHFWAGLGVYALCRSYRLAIGPSLLGGVAFLSAPFLLAQTAEGHVNQVFLIAWIPWAWLAFERWRRQHELSVPLLSTVLALMVFCGHAQEILYLVLILSCLVGIDILRAAWARDLQTCVVTAGRWTVVIITLAGLASIEVIPNWIYAKQSIRAAGIGVEEACQYSMGWENLWQLIAPMSLGGPDDYTGPGTFYWETLCYFGVIPTGLAILGLVRDFRLAEVRRMGGVLLAAVLFSLGTATPTYPLLHRFVPAIAMFRVPSRALFFASFAIAVLAAIGLQRLTIRIPSKATNHETSTRPTIRRWWRLLAICVGAACLGELSWFSHCIFSTIPAASIRSQNPLAEFLSQNTDHDRVAVSQELLSDREAWPRKIQKIQGYEPVPLQAYTRTMQAATPRTNVMPQMLGFSSIDVSLYDQQVLGAMGVRFAVQEGETPLPTEGDWKVVATGTVPCEFTLRDRPVTTRTYRVLENLQTLPRAYVVGQARPQDAGQEDIEQLRQIHPRREVLLANDILPEGKRSPYLPARIVEYAPDRIAIDVSLPDPGYLVLSDTWYPGWTAVDNSHPIPILRANLAFRAVPLTAGSHHVVMQYTPSLQRLASTITLTTLLCLAAAAVIRFGRGRKANHEPLPPKPPAPPRNAT